MDFQTDEFDDDNKEKWSRKYRRRILYSIWWRSDGKMLICALIKLSHTARLLCFFPIHKYTLTGLLTHTPVRSQRPCFYLYTRSFPSLLLLYVLDWVCVCVSIVFFFRYHFNIVKLQFPLILRLQKQYYKFIFCVNETKKKEMLMMY